LHSSDLVSYTISDRPVLSMSRKGNCLDNAVIENFRKLQKQKIPD